MMRSEKKDMFQRDFQTVAKSSLLVVVTAISINYLVSTLPADRSLVILVGHTVLLTVLGAFIVSIDFARYNEKRALGLLPQTQLALWLAGIVAVMLATDGVRWFDPNVVAWIFVVITLTLASRGGFVWLWHQLVARLKPG